MNVVFKLKSFTFSGKTDQEAYLKGCKELAKFLAPKAGTNVSLKVNRVNEQAHTFEFVLYTNIDASAEQSRFCAACKEFHCSFYINEDYNCSRCNLKSYLKHLKQRGNISKAQHKKKIK